MSTPTVFLSAASIDLREWREVLDGAFRRGGFRVLTHDESLSSAPGNVKRLLTETIAESDCIIHLAGLGHGSDATDPFPDAPDFQCSWTQLEYYLGHREKKDLIAFVCAPALSKAGFTEEGTDPADIARKQRLQQAHRQRVERSTFENTPLPNTAADRTSNESIPNVAALLTAVAAAVGTLHKLDRAACAKAQQELSDLAAGIAAVKTEVIRTRCLGIKAFAVILLALVVIGAGLWQFKKSHDAGIAAVLQGQKANPESIRAAYREASGRKLAEDNAAAERATPSAERQRLRAAAAAAHEGRLSRIDYHIADFIRLADDPNTTAVMREMIRILSDPAEKDRVETALAYADQQKAGVLDRIHTRNAAIDAARHEQNRTELAPLLKAAELQATRGENDKARAAYAQLLELEPAWPTLLSDFAYFLYTQSIQAQSYGTLATALADAQQCQTLAQQLLAQAPENRDSQRLLSVSHNQLGDLAVAQGNLPGALRRFTNALAIAERLAAWQCDLSYSNAMIAEVMMKQSRWRDALPHMERSLVIDERLAASDSSNVMWQNDAKVSRRMVAQIRAKLTD